MNDEQRKLAMDNINLVYYVLKQLKVNVNSQEFDDYYQQGCLGLCRAAEIYDPTNSKFSTYAYHAIANEIKKMFRSNERRFMGVATSLDKPLRDGLMLLDLYASDDNFIENLENSEIIDKYNALEFPFKDLYNDYLNGMGGKELEQKYHIKRASSVISRTKKYLRKKFEKETRK